MRKPLFSYGSAKGKSASQKMTPLSLSLPHQQPSQHLKPSVNRTRIPIVILVLISPLVSIGLLDHWARTPNSILSFSYWNNNWRDYTFSDAAYYVRRNRTIIVSAVTEPYLPFLNNWLIGVARQKQEDRVLVIAEDNATLVEVNERWPGHAALIPPMLEGPAVEAHEFGSQGFFNLTARKPSHLLQLLELGYNVMYNDVDMVWLADPFPYLEGEHDVYLIDDATDVKPLNHSHNLPPPGKTGHTYICSCMIYLRNTTGAKLLMKKWIEELQDQPWSTENNVNDQPAFNRALNKTAGQVDVYILPQKAFPPSGLYFKNETWVNETKGMHVLIHNNYVTGLEKKIERFREYGLWLFDDHSDESPLSKLYYARQRALDEQKENQKQNETESRA